MSTGILQKSTDFCKNFKLQLYRIGRNLRSLLFCIFLTNLCMGSTSYHIVNYNHCSNPRSSSRHRYTGNSSCYQGMFHIFLHNYLPHHLSKEEMKSKWSPLSIKLATLNKINNYKLQVLLQLLHMQYISKWIFACHFILLVYTLTQDHKWLLYHVR